MLIYHLGLLNLSLKSSFRLNPVRLNRMSQSIRMQSKLAGTLGNVA